MTLTVDESLRIERRLRELDVEAKRLFRVMVPGRELVLAWGELCAEMSSLNRQLRGPRRRAQRVQRGI